MADKSTYFRDAVLNILRGTTVTGVTAYVSLHDDDPGLTGADEITGGSYARQTVTLDIPDTGGGGRQTANTGAVTFTGMPAVTVEYVGIWDSLTGGNFLYGDALSASQVVNAGGTFEFPIGNLVITES